MRRGTKISSQTRRSSATEKHESEKQMLIFVLVLLGCAEVRVGGKSYAFAPLRSFPFIFYSLSVVQFDFSILQNHLR